MQFVVICISVSRQASPLLNLPLLFLFLCLPTTESSLSPPCCLTSFVTCPSSTKPWVILGNQFSPSFTLRRGCRAGVHSLWQPNPRKVPQGQTSVRVLVQTRFCGEWNLEFGSNTTEKFEISRGAASWYFKLFCGVWKPSSKFHSQKRVCD